MKRNLLVFMLTLLVIFSLSTECQLLKVKIMAANITSGRYQRYEGPGIRIFQALKPDICCVQEFNYDGSIHDFVNEAFGKDYTYYRESYDGIPNGVIFRKEFKVLDKGSWDDPQIDNRGITYVRLDVPGDNNPHIFVISVHLSTKGKKQVAAANAIRADLCAYFHVSDREMDKIPDYLVIAGDFNAGSRQAGVIQILKRDGLVEDRPIPVDSNTNSGTNSSRRKSHDFVLTNELLTQHISVLQIKDQVFTNGIVFDSRVFKPLSDVAPVQQHDSASSNMQHMAVMKVFLIPSEK